MSDETEDIRRYESIQINGHATDRSGLEQRYGQVWDTQQLQADFEVQGFLAPYVGVRRKSDGQVGSLQFQHCPRFYFNFTAAD